VIPTPTLEFGDKPEATAAIRTIRPLMSTIVTKPFCQLSALTFIGNSRTENLLQTQLPVSRPAQQNCSQVQNLHTFFRLSESPDGEKPTHWRTVSYREDKGRVSPTAPRTKHRSRRPRWPARSTALHPLRLAQRHSAGIPLPVFAFTRDPFSGQLGKQLVVLSGSLRASRPSSIGSDGGLDSPRHRPSGHSPN